MTQKPDNPGPNGSSIGDFSVDNSSIDNSSIDGDGFVVLRNGEGQYSLWPSGKAAPEGWTRAHPPASKAECLAFVEAKWTDMRPGSITAAGLAKPRT
jgi:MbtH protein